VRAVCRIPTKTGDNCFSAFVGCDEWSGWSVWAHNRGFYHATNLLGAVSIEGRGIDRKFFDVEKHFGRGIYTTDLLPALSAILPEIERKWIEGGQTPGPHHARAQRLHIKSYSPGTAELSATFQSRMSAHNEPMPSAAAAQAGGRPPYQP
jgi:hypothetical protein